MTVINDEEVLLLVLRYMADDSEKKACDRVLCISIGVRIEITSSPMTARKFLSLNSCVDDIVFTPGPRGRGGTT